MELRPPTSDAERGRSPAIVRAFLAALVEVVTPEGHWTVQPDPQGRVQQKLFTRHAKQLPIITAYNPGGVQRPDHINEAAQLALRKRLEINGVQCWPALGRSQARDWGEQSMALVDLPVGQAATLSRDYDQAAFFLWTPGVLSVVWTPRGGPVTADMRHATAALTPRA